MLWEITSISWESLSIGYFMVSTLFPPSLYHSYLDIKLTTTEIELMQHENIVISSIQKKKKKKKKNPHAGFYISLGSFVCVS